MLDEITDETTSSIRTARVAELAVSVAQQLIVADVIERLESLNSLNVIEISPIWYKIECRGMKVQIELRNPGGYIDILKLPYADGSLSFPHNAWDKESVQLQLGNEELIVRKILSNFAILRSGDLMLEF